MTAWQILVSVILGLAVNEFSELCPWCARKLVRWSAHCRYADAARADARAEELSALIDERPGKLFKLITALGFTVAAVAVGARRAAARWSAAPGKRRAELPAYSGPDTLLALLLAVTEGAARFRRAVLLMVLIAPALVIAKSAGALLLGLLPFHSLGMLGEVPAAGMAVTGLITTISWWRRRARSTPGAWLGLVWEAVEGRIVRPVFLAMSWGGVVLLYAGTLLNFRILGTWGLAPAAGLIVIFTGRWRKMARR